MIMAEIGDVCYKLAADYSICEQASNKTASEITVILDENQPIPKCGEIIEVKDDKEVVYFLGVCGIPKSPKFSSPYDVRKYSITCSNANSILARRVVNVAYKNLTISEIVLNLYEKYIAAEGFGFGNISSIPITLNVYTAADYGLQYCLDELAEYVNGAWYCTNDRKFYFTAKDDFEPFKEDITDNCIPITDLEVKVKDTDMRTSQIISGGKAKTIEQREKFTYEAKKNTFELPYSLIEKPIIIVNEVAVSPDLIGVKGLNDNDNSIMFLYANDSSIITYNTNYNGINPPKLEPNNTIEIRYIGLFPIRAVVQNAVTIAKIASDTGTSGIIDNVRLDKSICNVDDAVQLGNALLNNYGTSRTELSGWFTMQEAQAMGLCFEDFQLLKLWKFNLCKYGVCGDFVLTERTITPFIQGGGVENLKIAFKLVDRAYMQSYGQVFQELNKAVSQLSIRDNDIIVDVEACSEKSTLTEVQDYTEYTDFTVLYCTSEEQFNIDGQIASPTGLTLYAWNTQIGG